MIPPRTRAYISPPPALPSTEINRFRTDNTTRPATPVIRYRSRTGLRPWHSSALCAGFELIEGESIADRLKLECRIEIDYPHAAAIAEWVEHVSGREGCGERPLLEIDSLTNNFKPKVRTAKRYEHQWIISMHGTLANARLEGGSKALLDLTVELNMTRLLANQPATSLPILNTLSPEDLFLQTRELQAVRAVTRDGADNFLVGCARRGGTTFEHRARHQRQLVNVVLTGLHRLLCAHLVPNTHNGLPNAVGVTICPPTLAQAEVYWEFQTPSALSVVATIADRLTLASNQATVRSFYPGACEQEVSGDRNALIVSIKLSDTVRAVFYSKTADVIRVEIRYLKDIRTNAGRLNGVLTVADLLNAVHHNAFTRLARIRSALMQIADSTNERADLLDFLRAIDCAAAGSQAHKAEILDVLVNLGAVAETDDQGFAPRATCERLTRSGVLERVSVRHGNSEPRRYALTSPYRILRNQLVASLPSGTAIATGCTSNTSLQ